MHFRARRHPRSGSHAGFTLIELLITLTVLAVVMVVLVTILQATYRSKTATSNQVEAAQAARVAVDMMARDLRSAGYGADLYYGAQPQPAIAYIDSLQVLMCANFQPYPETDTIPRPPLAYNPGSTPRPFPLVGTQWQPPIKYRRGAELIRWTLDVNNNGAVDVNDIAAEVDARRTPNPNDYVLVRQVYGDSTSNIAGYNGGQIERVALVRRPGGTVPPMFKVYLGSQAAPWDWSLGPVPATKLAEISRIQIEVVAPSSRPNKQGEYAESRLRTEVNSIRNVPNFGRTEYPVDGYIFHDNVTANGVMDVGEPGLANASVRLGPYGTVTTAAGYFIFRAPAGTYTLRHTPPPGFGVATSPDSFVVTVGPASSHSFADTARAGGWVDVSVYEDLDKSASYDSGEPPLQNVRVALTPGTQYEFTDAAGKASLFAPEGGYSIAATLPDSFVATTANPVTGTMPDGGSGSVEFGMGKTDVGYVSGTVFRDNNRNGALDGGEPGMANVWVGVTPDNGSTILAYQYTDANGEYYLTVPVNDPPHTVPYTIMTITPGGYYPTSTTSITPIWLQASDLVKNQDFGVLGYQVIVLNASRVLSLASGDLVEKQGSDNGGSGARQDPDIVLGADAGGTDNVSVWFNQYDATPVFDPDPIYTRNAPQSVLSLSLDTLDSNNPKRRPDLVTGTRNAAAGNFFVWLNQNSGGNEGYFPTSFSQAYRTADNGDVQAVATLDCAGPSTADQVDILVGTKSPTAGQGTIELWESNNAATPTFSRLETYPPAGAIPGDALGEVNTMALADMDGDGLKDLMVGTRLTNYTGQLMLFRNNGKSSGSSRFTLAQVVALPGVVTCMVPTRSDYDSDTDVILGLQTNFGSGELWEFTNVSTFGTVLVAFDRRVSAPGIPLSLVATDLGGVAGHDDLVLGWRENETSYVGGVRVLSLDSGGLPATGGTDPSSGSIVNMIPALTVNNFNYGVQPVIPPLPHLTDVAAGVKITSLTGALVVFIR